MRPNHAGIIADMEVIKFARTNVAILRQVILNAKLPLCYHLCRTTAAGPSTSQAPAAATAAAKAKKAPAPTAGTSQSAAGHGKTAGLLFQGNNLTAAKAGQGAGSSQVKTASPGRAAQPKHEAEQRFAGEAMAGYEYEFATQEVSQEMTQELDQGATAGAKTIAQVLGKSEVAIMMPDRISRNKVCASCSAVVQTW